MSIAKFIVAGALALGAFGAATSVAAQTIGNSPTGGSIASFGFPDSQTYGQVFTAPVTGTLDSFTLYLDGGISGDLYGGVGEWNGTPTHSTGGGVDDVLFTSGNVSALSGGAFTFTPNISVVAGQLYVAYLSVFGLPNIDTGATSMPLGTSAPNLNYFVWNNSASPSEDSWNYFFNTGNARFEASFNGAVVPEPATWALMIGGFGLAGAALRRRRSVAATA